MCCTNISVWCYTWWFVIQHKYLLKRQVMTENTDAQLKWDGGGRLEKLLSVVLASSGERNVRRKYGTIHTSVNTNVHTQTDKKERKKTKTCNLSSTYKEAFSQCSNRAPNRSRRARRWFQRAETHRNGLSWTLWNWSYCSSWRHPPFLTQHIHTPIHEYTAIHFT